MKIKNLFALATVAMAMTACSNTEDLYETNNFPEDGVIRVTTNVDTPKSRAGITNDNLSSFYMYIVNFDSEDYTYFVQMKKEEGVWNSYDLATNKKIQMLWKNNTTPITVNAVYLKDKTFVDNDMYLFASTITSMKANIPEDQSTAANVEASDFVSMVKTVISPDPKENDPNFQDGKVKITFKHALSKLNIKLTLGTEFNTAGLTAENNISKVLVGGTKVNYDYYIAGTDAKPQPNADYPKPDIKTCLKSYTAPTETQTKAVANYECILVPQEIEANIFSVEIVINGKNYVWSSPNKVTLESGKAYTLELLVGDETTSLYSISAKPWTETSTESVETE